MAERQSRRGMPLRREKYVSSGKLYFDPDHKYGFTQIKAISQKRKSYHVV